MIYNALSYPYINGFSTIPCGFSDHDLLIFGYKKPKINKPRPKVIHHISFTEASLSQIEFELNNIDISSVIEFKSYP